jgi:large conductance mechanosensitive channel
MKEFKEFISRGNVMDMAVGIIIGGAFTAIVSSLVADIITPIIGMILGGVNFSELALTVGSAQLTYGNFIQAIINFLIIAWVVFMMVKAMNKMKKKEEEKPAEPAAPAEPSEDIVLLREIRDSLKK